MDKYAEFLELDRQLAELASRVPSGTREQHEEWHNQRRATEADLIARMRAIIPTAYHWVSSDASISA